MDKLPQKLIADSFGLTAEAIASVFVQAAQEPIYAPAEPVMVRLSLSNVEPVVLEFVAGRPLGRVIAARWMGGGADGSSIESHSVDALKELINVTGGALAGIGRSFDAEEPELSCPVSEPFSSDTDWSAFVEDKDTCVLDVGGHTIALRIRIAA